jgi:hypothetical protein
MLLGGELEEIMPWETTKKAQNSTEANQNAEAPGWLVRTGSFLKEREKIRRVQELKEREERDRAEQARLRDEERLRNKRADIQARLTKAWRDLGLDSVLGDVVKVVWPGGHVHRGFFAQDPTLADYRLLGLIYQTHVYRETRMVGPEGLTIKSYSFWIAKVLFSVGLYEDRLVLGCKLPDWSHPFWRGMFKNMDGIEVLTRDEEMYLSTDVPDRMTLRSVVDRYLSRQLRAESQESQPLIRADLR